MTEENENYDDEGYVENDDGEDFSSLGEVHHFYETYEEPEPNMPHPNDYKPDQQERFERDTELARERQRGQAYGAGVGDAIHQAGQAAVSPEEELYAGLGPEDKRRVKKIADLESETNSWEKKALKASVRPGGSREMQEHRQRAQSARDELNELTKEGFQMDRAARKHHSATVGDGILRASTFDGAAFRPAVQAIESAIDDYNRETEDNKLFAVIKRQSGFEHGSALAPHFDGRDICEIDFSNRPELIGMAEDKTGDDLIDYALKNGLTITRVSLDLDKWGKPVVKKASEQDTVAKTPAKKFLSPLAMQVNAGIFSGGK